MFACGDLSLEAYPVGAGERPRRRERLSVHFEMLDAHQVAEGKCPRRCVKAEVVEEDGHRVVPIGRDQSTEKEPRHTMADELRIGLAQLLRKSQMEH
jgi:hypothetical protein